MSVRAEAPLSHRELPVTIIEPSRGWVALQLRELWEYRELLFFLAWRDVKVRYAQTALGAAWALIQPLFQVAMFSFLFGKIGKIPSDGIPYPLFMLAGLVPWTYFAYGLSQSANSLISSQNLIQKVYFPRLVIPIASMLAGLVDTAITFGLLIMLMLYYGVALTVNMLWLPLFFLLAFITALGVGLWSSALKVRYRDVKHAIPFLTQFWMYATPVAYSISVVPEPWRTLVGLNPMLGVVEGFRWALLGSGGGPGAGLSVGMSVVCLVGGVYYFRRMEKSFADLV